MMFAFVTALRTAVVHSFFAWFLYGPKTGIFVICVSVFAMGIGAVIYRAVMRSDFL